MIENNPENLARIRSVGENLLGSCGSLDNAIQGEFGEDVEITDIATELLQELDDITMECEDCGWWCEASEFDDGGQTCVECREV